jgi:uncharacterized protein YqeY
VSLHARLEAALRDAMRAGDELRRSTLRMALAAAHNRRIELRRELRDEEIVEVLARQGKQHRESIEHYRAGGRDDRAAREEAELAIIEEFLPAPLGADELEDLIRTAIAETGATGPSDLGRVMGRISPHVKGRADGREVADEVRRQLAG